jgi:hypothetical protein
MYGSLPVFLNLVLFKYGSPSNTHGPALPTKVTFYIVPIKQLLFWLLVTAEASELSLYECQNWAAR